MESSPPSPWSRAGTVAGFLQSPPNATLMRYAHAERARRAVSRVLDIGCGAGRNAAPLAEAGFEVIGLDLSWPMLQAAHSRPRAGAGVIHLAQSDMGHLPIRDGLVDLVIAHGIWNLATSGAEFRRAVREAARVSRPGAGLFVFTFSRNTLATEAAPVPGEAFIFTQFSGQPQCFLNEEELVSELATGGFALDQTTVALTEHNLPRPGQLRSTGGPVIFEGAFRFSP
jgi:SAM-dependent methyltransferase